MKDLGRNKLRIMLGELLDHMEGARRGSKQDRARVSGVHSDG